jgi:hypothetical protein
LFRLPFQRRLCILALADRFDIPPRKHDVLSVKLPPPDSLPRFYSEPPTKQKNVTASVYQSLLSVFDELTEAQRMEFVDLASRYASLDAAARADLVDLLPLYAQATPAQRLQMTEILRAMSEKPPR